MCRSRVRLATARRLCAAIGVRETLHDLTASQLTGRVPSNAAAAVQVLRPPGVGERLWPGCFVGRWCFFASAGGWRGKAVLGAGSLARCCRAERVAMGAGLKTLLGAIGAGKARSCMYGRRGSLMSALVRARARGEVSRAFGGRDAARAWRRVAQSHGAGAEALQARSIFGVAAGTVRTGHPEALRIAQKRVRTNGPSTSAWAVGWQRHAP
ncbi:hypothetical protein ERJ75_001407600 [Trypanosoma vivax]|nr:hypothetical protein ERJ75_001407600 [Trypanosoma vivax]